MFLFDSGEVAVPRTNRPLPNGSEKLVDMPEMLVQIMRGLYVRNSPKRFMHGEMKKDCWVWLGNSRTKKADCYPVLKQRGHPDVSVRRLLASLYYELDAAEYQLERPLNVIMKCGNKDCVQPWHMCFATHPNFKVEG